AIAVICARVRGAPSISAPAMKSRGRDVRTSAKVCASAEVASSGTTSAMTRHEARTRFTSTPSAQPELPDHGDGLEEDLARHLALTDAAVLEDDRDLDHLEALAHGAPGQLDLERVARAAYRAEIERLEHLA